MGKDIHINIVRDKKEIAHNLYDGRNSEWFDNLTGRMTTEPAYKRLPDHYDWDDCGCPHSMIEQYSEDNGYFDHRRINVKDFIEWYDKYKPYLKAGYVTRYEAWCYKKKGIIPDPDSLEHYAWSGYDDEEAKSRIIDKVWIEFEYEWEPSIGLYEYINEHDIPDDAWIVYCFDW